MGITIAQYRLAIGMFGGGCVRDSFMYSGKHGTDQYLHHDSLGTWLFEHKRKWTKDMLNSVKRRSKYGKQALFNAIGFSLFMHLLILLCGDVHMNPGPNDWSDLSLCHVNIRSLRGDKTKLDHIACGLGSDYDIITVSETWLNSSCSSASLQLSGFQTPFRKDRANDLGYGGVLVWTSIKVAAKRRPDLELPQLEALWLEIRSHNNKFLLCTIYRPPNDGIDFWNNFGLTLELAKETNITNIIISGDLNADPASIQGGKLKAFLDSHHLVAHVKTPTRITETSSTILDQFMTNIPNFVKNVRVEAPVSYNDHCTIGMDLLFRIDKSKAYKRHMWDFKNSNFDNFRAGLSTINFDRIFESDNVDDVCRQLSSSILKVAKETILNKMVTVRPNDKPWFNGLLRRLLRIKNRSHKKAKLHNTAQYWAKFRQDRNSYINNLKQAKKAFEENKYQVLVEEGKSNNKKWWTILKSLLGQTNDSSFPPMCYDDRVIVDDKGKADAFNEYFSKASLLDDSNAELPDFQPLTNMSLEVIQVTTEDVLDQLRELNISKAYGPDEISPRFLKEGKDILAKPLAQLYNLSLQQQKFPAMLKQANVLPIHKKDMRDQCGNYRPVSLLSANSKIFEKIVFKYVFNYFRDNLMISTWQSGFLPRSSTITQLIEIYDSFCKAVADGKEVRVVFLDISKAFDRVWHKGLLHKLKQLGIKGSLLKWFEDYLNDRFQRVIINGQFSDWIKLLFGVPQGSVLGPLLFLVFIDDVVRTVHNCDIRMFADDTCLFITVDNRDDAAAQLTEDLQHVSEWANKWLVDFSPTKTKEMIISNKDHLDLHPSLVFNNHVIDRVQTHKHLGITLSSDLKWTTHINNLVRGSSKRLDLMRGLKYNIDRRSLETIYKSFVRPCVEYGDCLWAGTYETELSKLDNVQVEAMRIVTGATAGSNINALCQETGWQLLSERRYIHSLSMLYKIINGEAPVYLSALLPPLVRDQTNRCLRNSNEYRVPFSRLESYRRSFFPKTLKDWNELDSAIQERNSLESFKSSFSKEKDPMRELLYYGSRWPSVHHARIRIGCSKLNSHLCYNLHVVPSPFCSCGHELEDPSHYFFFCPLFDVQRRKMMDSLLHINNIDITLKTLLWGDPNLAKNSNEEIFLAVHEFISETARFD